MGKEPITPGEEQDGRRRSISGASWYDSVRLCVCFDHFNFKLDAHATLYCREFQALLLLWLTIKDHDTLFVLAEVSHFLGIAVLAFKLQRKRSVAGECSDMGPTRTINEVVVNLHF